MFFEYPRLLWLEIIPLLLILHYIYLEWRQRSPHLRVSVITPWIASGKSVFGILRHIPFLLRILAIVMIIIAIARPRSSGEVERIDSEGIDIMLAMDVSTSMLARDFTPDRLSAAKDIAIEFIAQRPYDRIGIVVFAGESFTQCPMTTDRSTLINLMKEVQTDLIEDGTAIGNGRGAYEGFRCEKQGSHTSDRRSKQFRRDNAADGSPDSQDIRRQGVYHRCRSHGDGAVSGDDSMGCGYPESPCGNR